MAFQPGVSSEDSALESHRILDYLFQGILVCFYWIDPQGRIYRASDDCQALTGELSVAEFFAQIAVDPTNQAEGAQCVAGGRQYPQLLHWVDPQGQERWIAHVCRVYFAEGGQPYGHVGMLVDITGSRAAALPTQRARSRSYALYQVLEALNRATTLAEVQTIAVEGVLKVLQSDRASLLLFGPDKRPHFVAWRHLSAEYRRLVDGHSPWAMDDLNAQPLWYEDVTQSTDFSAELQALFRREGIRALAFIPLVGNQHLLGKFMVYYNAPHLFTEEERHLAQILANYLSTAISRLRAWQALAESEARLKGLINATPDVIIFKDEHGRWLEANAAALQLFGLEGIDYRGKTDAELAQLIPCRLQKQSLFAECQRVKQADEVDTEPRRSEITLLDQEGERRILDVLRVPVPNPEGAQRGLLIIARDITEHKRAEEALRESETRFRALAESTMAAIYVIEGERFTYVNPALTNLTGYSAEELKGMRYWELVHPDFQSLVRARGQARQEGKTISPYAEFKIRRRDGSERWVLVGDVLIWFSGRQVVVGSAVDITEHKRYEQALEAEVQLVQRLGEVPEVGVEPLWEHMLAAVQRVIPAADRVALFLLDEEGRLCVRAIRGYRDTRWLGYCFDQAIPAMQILYQGRSLLIPDVQASLEIPHQEEVALAQSALVAPLLVQDVLLGVLALDNIHHTHAFDEGDLRILEHFATTATLLLEDARLVKNLQQRSLEMESVHRVTKILREASSVSSALQALLSETLAAVESDVGAILLYDPEEDLLRPAVSTGWFRQLDHPLRPGEGIGGTVFLENRPYFSEDFVLDALVPPQVQAEVGPGWGGACLPLHTSEDVLGVMFVALPPGRRFTQPQRYLLETLAEIGGITLHRIRLHEETQRRLEQLQVLQAMAQAITGRLDLGLTLKVVVERVRSEFNVDAVDVLLMDQHLLTLSFVSGIGFQTAESAQRQVLVGDGLAGEVALRGRKVIPNLRLGAPLREKCRHFLQQERFQAYVGLPLMTKGNLKGVLELFHRAPKAFTKDQLEFLEDLARYAAIAIDNAQMFESLQRSAFEVRAAYDATIEGWARALELRDRETEGHAQRVVRLTLALARRLGVPEERLVHIRRGALLHDIGKLGVPDRILHKPGPLTEEERLIMQRHPVLGYEMLKDIEYLQPALIIPLFHHERWDGSGYPRGLKGEQIPLEARIFAVVDVYDALRSDRPYRPAWTREQALAFIREQSGKLFDPQVVAAFLSLIEEEEERAA